MQIVYADLWNLAHGAVLAITTNGTVKKDGACVMGRGIAREAAEKFPELPYRLGNYLNRYGNRCFNLGIWENYRLVSFPVKHNWWEKADISLIECSARQLVEMAVKFNWERIFLPRPGCGNGGLKWEQVKPVLENVLDDRFVVCTKKIL